MSFTDKSFEGVMGTGAGETWRRLHRRWDLLTTGRAKGLLSEILTPGRAKLAELQSAVECLECLMRRFCMSLDTQTGLRHTLAADIRMVT
eukprot:3611521-Amphidinium_carterae.1